MTLTYKIVPNLDIPADFNDFYKNTLLHCGPEGKKKAHLIADKIGIEEADARKDLWEGYHFYKYLVEYHDKLGEQDQSRFKKAVGRVHRKGEDKSEYYEYAKLKRVVNNSDGFIEDKPQAFLRELAKEFEKDRIELFVDFLRYCEGKPITSLYEEPVEDTENAIAEAKKKAITKLSKMIEIIVRVTISRNGRGTNVDDENQAAKKYSNDIELSLPPVKENNDLYFGNRLIKEVLGREGEQQKLRDFLLCDKPFSWFQIAGVAGQGKSRLALELIFEAQSKGWNAGRTDKNRDIASCEGNTIKLNEKWQDWIPDRPHLIVFDYVIGREKLIGELLLYLAEKRNVFNKNNIRVLLVERQPWNRGIRNHVEVLHSKDNTLHDLSPGLSSSTYAEWFLSFTREYDGGDPDLSETRFERGVLELNSLSPEKLVIIVKTLAKKQSGEKLSISDDWLKDQLCHIDKKGRPLYAYFLGQIMGSGTITRNWSNTDLLNEVLRRERAKWWSTVFPENPPHPGTDSPASLLAVLSTMLNGLDLQDNNLQKNILKLVGQNESIKRHAFALTGYVIPKDKGRFESLPKFIPALQPDLLGEWFVLRSFEDGMPFKQINEWAWSYSPEKMAIFIQRLHQDFEGHTILKKILNFLDFDSLPSQVLPKISHALLIHFNSNKAKIPRRLVEALHSEAKSGDVRSMVGLAWCFRTGTVVRQDNSQALDWYTKAAEYGSSDAMASVGYFYGKGYGVELNRSEELRWYFRAAELGNIDAIYNIGVANEKGLGVERDFSEALNWYKKASVLGDSDTMNHIGIHYEKGNTLEQNFSEALSWYTKAAKAGNTNAMANVGSFYHRGKGIQQDFDLALKWYREAAKYDHSGAIYNIGVCFYEGTGVSLNYEEALRWFLKAAKQGNIGAMNVIGKLYRDGNGVEQNYTEAISWFSRAAASNNADALFNMGVLYQNGEGLEKNIVEALKWYHNAAQLGHSKAMANIGFIYYIGFGVKQDYAEALTFFHKAYEAGSVEVANNMGCCYLSGRGAERDYKKAVYWYLKASDEGDMAAMENMGLCYRKGKGVKKCILEALNWYSKAVSCGSKRALFRFSALEYLINENEMKFLDFLGLCLKIKKNIV